MSNKLLKRLFQEGERCHWGWH